MGGQRAQGPIATYKRPYSTYSSLLYLSSTGFTPRDFANCTDVYACPHAGYEWGELTADALPALRAGRAQTKELERDIAKLDATVGARPAPRRPRGAARRREAPAAVPLHRGTSSRRRTPTRPLR